MKLTVGTRGSKLSLAQTAIVIQKLKEKIPELKVEIKIIKTTGDKITTKPLISIKEKGIFEKEIDKAVLRGAVDFAVHSLKDVPTAQLPGAFIAAVPERGSPNDVLVSRKGLKLRELPPGAVVGTGSPRRVAQLRRARPDLKVKSIRGNIDTRVKKLQLGLYDAIILAEAGLKRLNMEGYITERLSLEEFTPAPGQGALAVVAKEDNKEVVETLKLINHAPSMASVLAERAVVKEVGGGCKVPLGAVAQVRNGVLMLRACILSLNGKAKVQTLRTGDPSSPEEVGREAARELLEMGAKVLIETLRGLS